MKLSTLVMFLGVSPVNLVLFSYAALRGPKWLAGLSVAYALVSLAGLMVSSGGSGRPVPEPHD